MQSYETKLGRNRTHDLIQPRDCTRFDKLTRTELRALTKNPLYRIFEPIFLYLYHLISVSQKGSALVRSNDDELAYHARVKTLHLNGTASRPGIMHI